MNDTLTDVRHRIIVQTKIFGVLIKCLNLNAAVFSHCGGVGAVQRCGHVMIWHSDSFVRCADLTARCAQTFKRLRACHFMNKVTVDIKQAGTVISLVGDMGIPDFIIDRFGGHKAPSCKIDMVCVWGTWTRRAGSAPCENSASSAVEPPRQAGAVVHVENGVKNWFHALSFIDH